MNVAVLDEVQLHLFRAGVPQFELWAADPGLLELPLTRELFTIASRIMYVRRLVRLPEYLLIRRRDDPSEHRRFLARLRRERRLWQDDYARRVREARVALCKHDSCKREPAIMYRVLSFLAAPVFDRPRYFSHCLLLCSMRLSSTNCWCHLFFYIVCDNCMCMSDRWPVASRLSGQSARPSSAF